MGFYARDKHHEVTMTATILHIRDYKTFAEREAAIGSLGMAIVSEALNGPTDQELFELEAGSQADHDCSIHRQAISGPVVEGWATFTPGDIVRE